MNSCQVDLILRIIKIFADFFYKIDIIFFFEELKIQKKKYRPWLLWLPAPVLSYLNNAKGFVGLLRKSVKKK